MWGVEPITAINAAPVANVDFDMPGVNFPSDAFMRGVAALKNEPMPLPSGDGGFARSLTGAIENVQGLESRKDALAVKAATGNLDDVHDYTIAATQAKLAMELTVAIRNKAVAAFNEIMRMPA